MKTKAVHRRRSLGRTKPLAASDPDTWGESAQLQSEAQQAAKKAQAANRPAQVHQDRPIGLLSSPQTLLEEVSGRYKRGHFDEQLFEMAETLGELTRDSNLEDQGVLKSRCLVAEIRDYRGRTKAAQEAVKEGGALWSSIQAPPKSDDRAALELAREQVRFVADYARVFFYREYKFKLAKEYLLHCRNFAQRHLYRPDLDFPCYGTQAQLNYYLGCAMRQLGELDAADQCYGRAIDNYRARAEHRAKEHQGDAQYIEDTLSFTRHRTAWCTGLGLGWVNYTRGWLTKALISNITPAQVLLMGSHDPINTAYLSLIRGSIQRCLSGRDDRATVDQAIEDTTAAYKRFSTEPYRHDSYAARAAFELSLNGLEAGNLEQAEYWITETERLATALEDARWLSNVWIVRSRISRREGDVEEALRRADRAKELVAGQEELLGTIDALIARGEALLDLGKLEEARGAFNTALERTADTGRNPKLEGVLNIHLARCWLLQGDALRAKDHLEQWQKLESEVEHQIVHELARTVRDQLDALHQDFWIQAEVRNLRYEEHNKALRRWLITQARKRAGGQKKIMARELLYISRQTLDIWEAELGLRFSVVAT